MKKFLSAFLLFFTFVQLGAIAQEYATPRKGEGVQAFLRRMGCNTPSQRQEFTKINKDKLSKDGGLIMGKKYQLPSGLHTKGGNGGSITQTLFGKNHQNVKITSSELSGACFFLVSGHGGPDPGAIGRVGKTELHEDEYAYDITLRLARALMEKGAKVHIIIQDSKDGIREGQYLDNSKRETCGGKAIPLDHKARLRQRCQEINNLAQKEKYNYERAIFIHVDSRSKKEQIDVFLYHAKNSSKGKKTAQTICNTLRQKYKQHQPNRGFDGTVSERNLYVLRNSNPVATFLEVGNIQNEKDRRRLIIPSNRQALANWICDGLVTDFKHR